MTEFFTYLELGYAHITDLGGYDHILFIVSLCAIYRATDWKRVLILITAFTVGHSITLVLTTLNYLKFDVKIIEYLIPCTILLTSFFNYFHKSSESILNKEKKSHLRYPLALLFGLIHGMGFSSYLKSLLGQDTKIIVQLFAFNLGLEFGQLFIVCLSLILTAFFLNIIKVRKHSWNLIVSSFVAGVAFKLLLEKWIF